MFWWLWETESRTYLCIILSSQYFRDVSPRREQNWHQSHARSSYLLKYIELFPEIIPPEISFQTHDDCPDGHIHSSPSAHQFKVLYAAIFLKLWSSDKSLTFYYVKRLFIVWKLCSKKIKFVSSLERQYSSEKSWVQFPSRRVCHWFCPYGNSENSQRADTMILWRLCVPECQGLGMWPLGKLKKHQEHWRKKQTNNSVKWLFCYIMCHQVYVYLPLLFPVIFWEIWGCVLTHHKWITKIWCTEYNALIFKYLHEITNISQIYCN